MDLALVLLVVTIVAALAFDFVNGFHDASNSIATIVVTKVLTPRQAVLWAASFNFLAVLVFDTDVAKTVGSGMVDLNAVSPGVILAGLVGATAWGILTWWLRLPTSSSHALLGGYAGAAIVHHALAAGWRNGPDVILASGWGKTLVFIVVAPLLGLVLGGGLMKLMLVARTKWAGIFSDVWFGRLQLLSSAFLSLTHGGNDAQKTAGIITGALIVSGHLDHFAIPWWVLVLSYGTIALGTLWGGWRIVETLGRRLTRLKPIGGFCAETAAASSILLATLLTLPVSTTHVTTGAVLGTGFARNRRAVRWPLAGRVLMAWIITLPGAALLGGVGLALAEAW